MKKTLTLALNYRCNNDCGFCFLKPERARPPADTPEEVIERVFSRNARSRGCDRLIISGAEATLRPDLAAISRAAVTRGGFSVVRLQTNGRLLADRAYCRRLVRSGVKEFLVSVHADGPVLDEKITGARGGFAQTRSGLASILACGGTLESSTVVSRLNCARLPQIAAYLLREGVRRLQFWSFIELEGGRQKAWHASLRRSAPKLREALDLVRAAGAAASVSWFPECLLGPHAGLLDNYSSETVICPEFEKRMEGLASFGCPRSAGCARFGRSCLGLHRRHAEVFPGDLALLKPMGPRASSRRRTCR